MLTHHTRFARFLVERNLTLLRLERLSGERSRLVVDHAGHKLAVSFQSHQPTPVALKKLDHHLQERDAMTVASALSTIAAPPVSPRTCGDFWREWISQRRRAVETDRKLFGSVPFETGMSDAFQQRRYGKRREDA